LAEAEGIEGGRSDAQNEAEEEGRGKEAERSIGGGIL
jgi:hypothetical protein